MPATDQTDDRALLRQFAAEHSEAAFATLVERHIGLVHSAALRQTGNPHAAEEITQAVFIILARKAGSLGGKVVLPGWLYQTARLTAANHLRTEIRRARREQEAHMNSLENEMSADNETWQQIAPLLDTAMGGLNEADRNTIVLRFFENKSMGEIAAVLDAPEATVRKRITRAIERLRRFFTKRGITLTAAAITGAVSANSVLAAPLGLAAKISAAAMVAGTSITTTMIILQKAIITAVVAAAVGTGIYEAKQAANARAELQTLQQQQAPMAEQIRQLQAEREQTANQLASLQEAIAKNEKDRMELLKLRGEVSVFRQQMSDLKEENGKLAAGQTSTPKKTKSPAALANSCINNLMQITAGMQQCALEFNLSATNVVSAEQILPYLKDQQLPQCPAGGTYTFGLLSALPTCSIPGHIIPSSLHAPMPQSDDPMTNASWQKLSPPTAQ